MTDHYNLEEPEFTSACFGYEPLESTGREWYYHPVDEVIYQEYSDREATTSDYLASRGVNLRMTNACLAEENEETQEDQQDEDTAMAWKRLRLSALHTVCKSMYIGALISLLTATVVGAIFMLVSYVSFKTVHICQFQPMNSTSTQIQWIRTMSAVTSCVFRYIWYFVLMLFLFRPFQ